MKSRHILLLLLFLLLYFLLRYYPRVGTTFDYWHMATAINIDKNIGTAQSNIGFYILTIIVSKITGITFEIIPLIPFQLVSLTLFLILLMRNISRHEISILLIIIIITSLYFFDTLMWWSHGIGFIMALTIFYIIILGFHKNHKSIYIILIMMIISLNYISYKMMFFMLSILIGLRILQKFQSQLRFPGINTVILIGIINALIFNNFFYDTFIPRLRDSQEVATLGTYKLFSFLIRDVSDPLNEYYLTSPFLYLRYANIIWLLPIALILILASTILFRKLVNKEELSTSDISIFTLIFSGSLILIIYTYLGISDMTFLILSGIIGHMYIYRKYQKFVIASVLTLLMINTYINVEYIRNDLDRGLKDSNFYEYVSVPSEWYIYHVNKQNPNIYLISDVFTGGYVSKEFARNDEILAVSIFEGGQALFILRPEMSKKMENAMVMINYRLYSISINNWNSLNSWSVYKQKIYDNRYLDVIYSTGDVDIGTII